MEAVKFSVDANTAVLDDDLERIPAGSGRKGMLARTGHIPLGYYKDPAKTAETFVTDPHGTRWVVPGDLAEIDADGMLVLYGRGSQCINSGGEKIFPEEVEAACRAHPDVYDAIVTGVPDERFGNKVVAWWSCAEGAGADAGAAAGALPRRDRRLQAPAGHRRRPRAAHQCRQAGLRVGQGSRPRGAELSRAAGRVAGGQPPSGPDPRRRRWGPTLGRHARPSGAGGPRSTRAHRAARPPMPRPPGRPGGPAPRSGRSHRQRRR